MTTLDAKIAWLQRNDFQVVEAGQQSMVRDELDPGNWCVVGELERIVEESFDALAQPATLKD